MIAEREDVGLQDRPEFDVPHAAGVLISREAGSWQTFGVENVLLENNLIRDVQNLRPPYDFGDKFASGQSIFYCPETMAVSWAVVREERELIADQFAIAVWSCASVTPCIDVPWQPLQ